jgi:hypothetical protein
MPNKAKIINSFTLILSLMFLLQPNLSYAERNEHHRSHNDSYRHNDGYRYDEHHYYRHHDYPSFGFHVSYMPDNYYSFEWSNSRYFYYDGIYYTRAANSYVVMPPPVGAMVYTIPVAYQPVVINSTTYYTYDGIYYVRTGYGYQVVSRPVLTVVESPVSYEPRYIYRGEIVPPGVVTQTAPSAPAAPPQEQTVQQSQAPAPAPTPDTEGTFTVNVPNDKGGFTPVILKKSGTGYIGPQGEFYPEFPKVEQLQVMYGK